MGVIDEGALEKISFIANLTKHIHVHAPAGKKSEEDERDLAPYFPQFMWLVRDFGLKLVDQDNNPITSRQYLDNALGKPSKDKSKNELRQVIQTVFPYRDCVTLVRPVVEEDELQNLDKLPEETLREKFRTDVNILTKKVLGKVKPKMILGQPINGSAFLNMVRSYIEAINTGAVPTIRNAWESVSELENKRAVEEAIAMYQHVMEELSKKFPVDHNELVKEHQQNHLKAKEEFSIRALGEQKDEYLTLLEIKLIEELDKFVLRNDEASEKQCKKLFDTIYTTIEAGLQKDEFPNCTELSHQWKTLVDKHYLPQAKGKFKYILLSDYLLERMSESLVLLDQSLTKKLQEQHAVERELLRSEINVEREDKKKLREEFTEVKQGLKSQLEKSEASANSLQTQLTTAQKSISELTQERDRLAKELNDLKNKNRGPDNSSSDLPEVQSSKKKKNKGGCVIQ